MANDLGNDCSSWSESLQECSCRSSVQAACTWSLSMQACSLRSCCNVDCTHQNRICVLTASSKTASAQASIMRETRTCRLDCLLAIAAGCCSCYASGQHQMRQRVFTSYIGKRHLQVLTCSSKVLTRNHLLHMHI